MGIFIMIVSSCQKETEDITKEYKQGDQVIQDGVIYTYYDELGLFGEEMPFVDEGNYKSFYNYYYYDMSDYKNKDEITPFLGDLVHTEYDIYAIRSFNKDVFHNYLKKCDRIYSPNSAQFYRLKDYFSPTRISNGFIVTGFTKDLPKDVVVPSKLKDIPVTQIGFKAFEEAPMETFIFETPKYAVDYLNFTLIHPFAFSNCPNLVELKSHARVLSMGISNCPKLKSMENVRPTMDCSLYNLPELETLIDIDTSAFYPFFENLYKNDNGYYDSPHTVSFYQTCGFEKSSIYLCPKLRKITGEKLSKRLNVVYMGSSPYYAFDDYSIMLLDTMFSIKTPYGFPLTYNPDTLEVNLPYLNTGLNYKGELYKDPKSTKIEENENHFEVPVSYPKIEEDMTDWSKTFNDPITLKINK